MFQINYIQLPSLDNPRKVAVALSDYFTALATWATTSKYTSSRFSANESIDQQ
jgi:hypothetical protein